MCVCACSACMWSPEVNPKWYSSCTALLLWDRVSHGPGLTKYDSLASSELQGFACPHLLAWDYKHTPPHPSTFVWLKLRSSCVLYLNCLPFPQINSPFFRWLGQRLPGSPIVKLPFLFFACWKQVTDHSPNLKSEIWCTNSLRRSRPELFRVSLHRRLVSSPLLIYLLEHLFMSAWVWEYIFYTLVYYPPVCYLFFVHVLPAAPIRCLFNWFLCSFGTCS